MRSRLWAASAAVAASLLAAAPSQAAEFTFIYTGAYSAADSLTPAAGGEDLLTKSTPFRLKARFDDSSLDLSSLLPGPLGIGWVAYRPITATFTIGGVDYGIAAFEDFAIALFDGTNIFRPGALAAGWIVEADLPPPIGDGPGTVGDWLGVDNGTFDSSDLRPLSFTNYRGAGFSSGPGCPRACTNKPLTLIGPGGVEWLLLQAAREEEFADGAVLQTARIVPAPLSLGLLATGLSLLAALRRTRARQTG